MFLKTVEAYLKSLHLLKRITDNRLTDNIIEDDESLNEVESAEEHDSEEDSEWI